MDRADIDVLLGVGRCVRAGDRCSPLRSLVVPVLRVRLLLRHLDTATTPGFARNGPEKLEGFVLRFGCQCARERSGLDGAKLRCSAETLFRTLIGRPSVAFIGSLQNLDIRISAPVPLR